MSFQVIFNNRADCDLKNYERRLAHMGGQTLACWRGRMLKVIHALETDPERYPESDEAEAFGMPLRDAFFGRYPHLYRLVYVIVGQGVYILRIRHAAQDRLGKDDL